MTTPVRAIALRLVLCCLVTWTSSKTQHPGFCPFNNKWSTCFIASPGPSCSNDAFCKEDQKCCLSGDRMQCVPATKGKEGVCPLTFIRCGMRARETNCKGDEDCPGKQKCCSTGCYKPCGRAIPALHHSDKTGSCPSFDATKCIFFDGKPIECFDHWSFMDSGSYYLPNCRFKCKPGAACSYFDASKCYLYIAKPECYDDLDCPGSCRCCCFDCKHQCMTTVKERPGQCPVNTVKECQVISSRCQNDYDCPEGLKCCECCGKRCVEPIKEHPGFCPCNNERISCMTSLDEPSCRNDAECNGNEKCCLFDGRIQCVPGLKEKPGSCPPRHLLHEYRSSNKCKEDKNCIGEEKCCETWDSKRCINLRSRIRIPGVLDPLNSYEIGKYKEPYVPGECLLPEETVGDHPVIKKCCDYNCDLRCV